MSYFKSTTHFRCHLNKVSRDNRLPVEQLLTSAFYLDVLSRHGLVDEFGWAITQDPSLMIEGNFYKWVQGALLSPIMIPDEIKHVLTDEFKNALQDASRLPGVYSFWSEAGEPLYIGMSTDLGSRPLSSFMERFVSYNKPVYASLWRSDTNSDAFVMEAACICHYKPLLNTALKHHDKLTLKIEIPDFKPRMLCNFRVLSA